MDQFLVFLLGVVAGSVAAFGLDLLREWYNRPVLQILGVRPEEGANYTVFSLAVTNAGRQVASHAQGTITIHDLAPDMLLPAHQVRFGSDLKLDPVK